VQQIKGAVLKSRLAFVEELGGKDGVTRVMAALPPADQRTLKLVFTSNWYPFPLGRALDEAIVQVLGDGRTDFFERLGEASAEKNLSTVHAGYLTNGDGHAFLSKSPSIYSLYYETGRREYQQAGPDRGRRPARRPGGRPGLAVRPARARRPSAGGRRVAAHSSLVPERDRSRTGPPPTPGFRRRSSRPAEVRFRCAATGRSPRGEEPGVPEAAGRQPR